MIKRYLKKINNASKGFKFSYLKFLELPIDSKLVLLEGGQGTNINGNMFSMLKEIETNPKYENYTCVFVVTENTIEDAKSRMAFYGFKNVILTIRNSKAYTRYLATAKYLMTDNSFPPYFYKRDEQVFLNTWHGTPLKTLGKSDKSNFASLANIQKNYLMSDFALFPNEFTRNVFMEDYDLKYIFSNKSLIANYPRNYVFYDSLQSENMKKELGYEGKKVFAYMPTWRGTGRKANTEKQISDTKEILEEFDSKLDDNTVLLVNLHFLLANDIDCSNYKHVDYFDKNYDTYEVLNACDGLITDYSSVFFDFAITKKKIVLYAYDKEKYLASRGTYIPFESLPFPITTSVDETLDEIKKESSYDEDFLNEYCSSGYIDSCEKLFDMMIDGTTEYFEVKDHSKKSEKLCMIYAGTLPKSHFENIKRYIDDNPEFKYVIIYRKNLDADKKAFILSLNENVTTFGTITAFQFNKNELLTYFNKIRNIDMDSKKAKTIFQRERNRLLYMINPDRIVDFTCGTPMFAGIMANIDCEKQYVKHGSFYIDSKRIFDRVNKIKEYEKRNGFVEYDMSQIEDQIFLETDNPDHIADISFRRNSSMINIIPYYTKKKGYMKCISLFRFRTPVKTCLKDTWLTVGDNTYDIKYYANTKKSSHKHYGICKYSIPIEDVVKMPSTNMVALNYNNELGYRVVCHQVYTALTLNKFVGLTGPFTYEKESDSVAVFRQSKLNRLNVYVRSANVSDRFSKRVLLAIAFIVSKLWHSKKSKKLVLLYEKNSSKYEESASVLYENLIDQGYIASYFIVDKSAIEDVPEKYRNNILIKHSFRHYLYFFKAKTFIGTEALVHAFDLKTFNRTALWKIADKNKNYVFLQHGVMYMVSLDSEARGMFKRKNLNGKYRVVTSSNAECLHFTILGRHDDEDIYVTGLPKYDRNILNDDADKITIMPTWRPWEINLARQDFTETNYFKMIMRIYNSVPEELQSKVVILPHPLILNELKKIPKSISDKILTDVSYDSILRETRVLITDYSSIAYDSFYRGSRVIFYWEEKDECMMNYGPSTKLMLNDDNVYGDVFYSVEGLKESILENYNSKQKDIYKERYSKIVQFHDGKNTERLIKLLEKDKIIIK